MVRSGRRCILHIGTEKTGTTTLQAFLDLNRAQLRQAGVLYTQSAGRPNNRLLAIAAFKQGRRDNATAARQAWTDADLEELQGDVLLKLKEEVAGSDLPVTVFSSEHFQSRLVTPQEIARLKEILGELGFREISVVVYLRRPADLAASLYSTAVRSGSQLPEPPDPSHPYWNLICNHQNTLTRWGAVFGRECLVPRLFTRQELVGGHIVDDFLDVIGLTRDGMEVPTDRNESVSADGIALLKLLNARLPNLVDGKINPLRGNIAAYVSRHFASPKFRIPDELVRRYDEAFADSDEWVRANFFPDRRRLFDHGAGSAGTEGTAPQWAPAELERVAGLLAEIWSDKQQRMLALQNRLGLRRGKQAGSGS